MAKKFWKSSDFSRLWATYETDTHGTVTFEGKWEKPRGEAPYIRWIQIEATPLKGADA